ncbi:MAG: hypothetical protein MJA82_06360 [Clostridia bacterium]|nr:hypothetical protein [Clostridia bacterium]
MSEKNTIRELYEQHGNDGLINYLLGAIKTVLDFEGYTYKQNTEEIKSLIEEKKKIMSEN